MNNEPGIEISNAFNTAEYDLKLAAQLLDLPVPEGEEALFFMMKKIKSLIDDTHQMLLDMYSTEGTMTYGMMLSWDSSPERLRRDKLHSDIQELTMLAHEKYKV